MSTEHTTETVAAVIANHDGAYDYSADVWVSARRIGDTVEIGLRPAVKGETTPFRVHVFPVTPEPPVATDPVDLDPTIARELAYAEVGQTREGWTVIERQDTGQPQGEFRYWLVISNEAGQHFGAMYGQIRAGYHSAKLWEYRVPTRFDPVVRHTKVVQVDSWLTRPELIKIHTWDELVFGGFICTFCTPPEGDPDTTVMWPCPPLRLAGMTDKEAIDLIVAHRAAIEEQARRAAQKEAKADD
ncbi:hypothetical protein [Streptosporangium sp. NPDC002524]|uniref:hypothetical protein n=1 Tax=Streptosporangium sp. NPDC002524 TaxID=3154537 RepID=UPI003327820D